MLESKMACAIEIFTFLICFNFRFIFDAMHAVTGAYAKPIFVDKLGANPVCDYLDGTSWTLYNSLLLEI